MNCIAVKASSMDIPAAEANSLVESAPVHGGSPPLPALSPLISEVGARGKPLTED